MQVSILHDFPYLAKGYGELGADIGGTLDLEGAQYNYNYALAIDSSNAKAYVGNGRIYALLNNPGMATGYLNKAYKIDPHLSEAYFLEGMIYRSDFYETGREESWYPINIFQLPITGYTHNPKLTIYPQIITIYPKITI